MLIASYNAKAMGDVLVVIVAADGENQQVKVNGNVVQIVSKEGQLLGYNFINASQLIPELSSANGQVHLSADQVATLNQAVKEAGFDKEIVYDGKPKFVVGYVEEMKDHPDSDHLHITTVDTGDEKLQIVCGSPNIANHIKVVVAKVGAMMPDGKIIFTGELRGVKSNGMICSGRELKLKNAPDRPGCVILPDDFGQAGDAFDFERGNHLFTAAD